jgi:hypothetical protein
MFLICIVYVTKPLLEPYRSEWTKSFAQEQPLGHGEADTGMKDRSVKWMNALFLLALVGFCAQITISTSSFSFSGLVLLAPWVR